jgi:hypothetical protein
MKRLIIAAVSLSLGLGGLSGSVLAQTNSGLVVIDDASGTSGTNRTSGHCEMSGAGRDRIVTCTDLRPDDEIAVTDPGTETAPPSEAASALETTEAPVATETAVASETDLDADNYPDALELEAGLDPTTIDTDGDGVADGDEGNIYGTDPTVFDTDGDGVSDGRELFDLRTDPLVWNNVAADSADTAPGVGAGAGSAPVGADEGAGASSVDSDNDRLPDADEAAVGTDPTTPDADGDGYYDGDEVNLNTDPLDPASVPAT